MGSVYNKKKHKTYHIHRQTEIKTVRGKTGFLKFIWKLESWRLFENWSFRGYLKIGFLEIKCKNEFFLEVKFERDWNLENYLRVRD